MSKIPTWVWLLGGAAVLYWLMSRPATATGVTPITAPNPDLTAAADVSAALQQVSSTLPSLNL
jgi:hypothetical protein